MVNKVLKKDQDVHNLISIMDSKIIVFLIILKSSNLFNYEKYNFCFINFNPFWLRRNHKKN